jgi:hypothetical protein
MKPSRARFVQPSARDRADCSKPLCKTLAEGLRQIEAAPRPFVRLKAALSLGKADEWEDSRWRSLRPIIKLCDNPTYNLEPEKPLGTTVVLRTQGRPASSRACRGSVQAETNDNREGRQRQPVESLFPFGLENLVGIHFFASSPTFVIDGKGRRPVWLTRAGMRLRLRWIWAGSARRGRHCHFE